MTIDRELTRTDLQALSNRDAVVSFFAGLGYQTDARITETCAAVGITADSLQRQIKHVERACIKEGGAGWAGECQDNDGIHGKNTEDIIKLCL